jgi:uncharacterized protein
MTPAYEITANGKSVTKLFAGRLRSLSVKDEAGMASDSCTIEVEDSERDIAVPGKGTEIEVSIGYEGALTKLGRFTIDEYTTQGPPDTIRIEAKAASFANSETGKAMQASKTRSWAASTIGDVAGKIATEHGLNLEISTSAAAIALPHLDQTAESDLHFLTRIAIDRGLLIKPAFGKLIVLPIKKSQTTADKDIPIVTIRRTGVSSYSFTGITRSAYTGVIARWHDATTGKERSTLAGSNKTPFTISTLCNDESTAKSTAAAMLARLERLGGEFSIEMPGRTDIIAEGRLQLVGFRADYDKIVWRIEAAEHTVDKAGYRTKVSGKVFSEAE